MQSSQYLDMRPASPNLKGLNLHLCPNSTRSHEPRLGLHRGDTFATVQSAHFLDRDLDFDDLGGTIHGLTELLEMMQNKQVLAAVVAVAVAVGGSSSSNDRSNNHTTKSTSWQS